MSNFNVQRALAAAALLACTVISTNATAQQGGAYDRHMGPGMMGGYGMGPGMMGPGMMGGYGMGGMMMGPGMGPGYGYGMGPGMMMGPGMTGYGGMGYGMMQQLNVTPEQRSKLTAIQDDFEKKNWDLSAKMRDEYYKLRDLMAASPLERSAVLAQYKKLQDLQLQSFQARIDAREKMSGALTPEQRQQAQQYGYW